MVYTHQDIQEFDKQIKELLDKGLIRNSKSHHTSPSFMVRNHAVEKRGKARMVINYKKLNDNTVFDGYYIPIKLSFSTEFKEPLGSQKWIAKVDISKSKWMKKAFL